MSKEQEKAQKQKKISRTLIIVLILIVLPAISYYWLNKGYKLRVEALNIEANYGKVISVSVIYPDGQKEDQIAKKVCVIHLFGEEPDLTENNRLILDTAERLFDQFGTNPNFRLVMIAKDGTAEFRSHFQKMLSAEYVTWAWTGAIGSWSTILLNGYDSFCIKEKIKPAKEYFALCDTNGVIKHFYNALDHKDVDKMAQHIAIILPPPTE